MRWIYLILASCCEVMWLYCVAYLNKLSWHELSTFSFINQPNSTLIFAAMAGYVGFGIANVIFFSKAIAKIPASIAFAVWTGLALVGITVIDFLWKDIRFNYIQIVIYNADYSPVSRRHNRACPMNAGTIPCMYCDTDEYKDTAICQVKMLLCKD